MTPMIGLRGKEDPYFSDNLLSMLGNLRKVFSSQATVPTN